MPQDTEEPKELTFLPLDEDIYDMSEYKLRKHFKYETSSSLNTSLLITNLIWQDYHKLKAGELEPFEGNVRSYWYARIKPVLSRCGTSYTAEKNYNSMISWFRGMALTRRLFAYAEWGFRDEGAHSRRLGLDNKHIICIAEKEGHMGLLEELKRDYEVNVIALGGQPSALSSEYFLAELFASGFIPDDPTPLLTIVDFDPAGNNIADNFISQMEDLGFPVGFERRDVFHPSHMTYEQIDKSRYHLPRSKREKTKQRNWISETLGLVPYDPDWENFGLEADALPWEHLSALFDEIVTPYLRVSKAEIVRRRMKRELVGVMKELLFKRLFG